MSPTEPVEPVGPAAEPRGGDGDPRGLVQRIRGWLRAAIVDNAALKFVALVLSITLFILVNTDKDITINFPVGVSYVMPEDRVLVSRPVDEVAVEIKGPRRRLRRFDERQLDRIHIDLTKVRGGQISFQPEMLRLPTGLEVTSFSPATMDVEFRRRTQRTVPVHIDLVGEPAPGYRVERIAANPSHVLITGSESVVEALSSVRTLPVDLDGRSESFRDTVGISSPQEYVDIANRNVEVDVTLIEHQDTRVLREVPVRVRAGTGVSEDTLSRFAADPARVTITLRGSVLALRQIDPAEVVAFAEVYLDDVTTGRGRAAVVGVEVPDGVAVEVSPRRVTLRAPR